MKTDLQRMIDERDRCFIPISEFSFATYPVQINHVFRCISDTANSPNQSRNRQRSELRRHISRWLRWACGKPAATPSDGNIPLGQAVHEESTGQPGHRFPMRERQPRASFARSQLWTANGFAACRKRMARLIPKPEDSGLLSKLCLPIFYIFRHRRFPNLKIEATRPPLTTPNQI